MKATGHNSETEIKLAVSSAEAARRMLRKAGFRLHKRRAFESNLVFDTADRALANKTTLLRVRDFGGDATVTFKGTPVASRHKSREEVELEVGDAAKMALVLERLGYQVVFRYEKYRAEYKSGSGVAMVDETPIGVYVELEGAEDWIDGQARRLGFQESDYITTSYGRLYRDWCAQRGVEPRDMVFEK